MTQAYGQIPYREESPFEATRFAENPDPRCPCVLVLDRSRSMSGRPIEELNAGLREFARDLRDDPLAARRVELAVVPCGPVPRDTEFHPAQLFDPTPLTADGDTPMGAALERAMDLIERQKQTYRRNSVQYYRPWILMITDGKPTDAWEQAAERLRHGEESRAFAFFPIGISGADFETLGRMSARVPMRLDGMKFKELFLWLSSSLRSVSRSTLGDRVALPGTTDWSSV